jgi:hypothetical protein
MNSNIGHSIKSRSKANDVFYTPSNVVKVHLNLIDHTPDDKWFDPFFGAGAYYNAFPTSNKSWTEITLNKDFFQYTEPCDIIASNPPYSMIDKVLEKSVQLNPRVISYLIGLHNLTTKRIEYMNTKGYYLKTLHMLKIYEWYGMSCIVVFDKSCNKNCISFDRTVYRMDNPTPTECSTNNTLEIPCQDTQASPDA